MTFGYVGSARPRDASRVLLLKPALRTTPGNFTLQEGFDMVPFGTPGGYMTTAAPVGSPGRCDVWVFRRGALPSAGARALLAFGAAVVVTGLARGAEAERPEDVVEMVIRATAHNYEPIKTAEVTIEVVSEEDPSTLPAYLFQPDPKRKQDKNIVDVAASASFRRTKRVIIRGDDVRYQAQGDGGFSKTTVIKDGVVSDYVPSTKQLAIRRPESLTVGPIDPREVGAVSASMGLADVLRSNRLLGAELIDRGNSTTVARVVLEYGRGRIEYEFDSSVGFLPTAELAFGADEYLGSWLRITYQEVLGGKARFLREAVRLSYPPRATKTPTETGWYQRMRQTVTGLRINQPVDESVFAINVPDGTVIADNINKTYSVQGQDSLRRQRSSGRFVWYGAGIGVTILLIFVAVMIYVRSR